ncbi:unnamed protein product [Angiostrongylus costaricensis]|uniref:Serrate RNA effector molecule n=1 Tax=Angiostrongylus costaricensis TaxID=334426 RepID=A0A0R3PGQ6_ANGCS|nr:unnamed protein product [Angiostrongylus costaricensis]
MNGCSSGDDFAGLTSWIKLISHALRSQADMSLYDTDIEFFWNENIEERRRERRERGLDSGSRRSPRRERDRDDRDRRDSRHYSGSSRRRRFAYFQNSNIKKYCNIEVAHVQVTVIVVGIEIVMTAEDLEEIGSVIETGVVNNGHGSVIEETLPCRFMGVNDVHAAIYCVLLWSIAVD